MKNPRLILMMLPWLVCFGHVAAQEAEIPRPSQKNVGSSLLSPIDQKILHYMELAHLPSVTACIIKNNAVVWYNAYGTADLRHNIPATPDTVYMAGSITKVFVATAFMQLSEMGYCDLSDDVNTYLPFAIRNPHFPDMPITIRMLLAHQSSLQERVSSLFYFDFAPYPFEWLREYLTPEGSIYDPGVWSARYGPGEGFEYANIGYEVLRYLFELISNQTIEAFCAAHILQPLQMDQTSFHIADFAVEDLAVPYTWRLHAYVPLPQYDVGMTAAGGIRTTVLDLARFFIAHMNQGIYETGQLLEKETVALMHSPQYPDDPDPFLSYGLGWMIQWSDGEMYEGHSGSVFGGVAFMFFRPSDNIGIIILANKNRVVALRPYVLESMGFIGLQELLFDYASTL